MIMPSVLYLTNTFNWSVS